MKEKIIELTKAERADLLDIVQEHLNTYSPEKAERSND